LLKAGRRQADNYTEGGTPVSDFSPEVLRQARELSGLTAGDLAERAGLHRVTVANYERGMHCPPDTWSRLEKALRLALEEHTRATEKMRKRLAA
jgi:ribosome-binding protein aMBF1 (putative translation factor)